MCTEDYCEIVSQAVSVEYHAMDVPVLGEKHSPGSFMIDDCSCGDDCCTRTSECPMFRKLNNL